ncbi:arsenate-mycothiol transferase ArsC [Arsenicicoccus bolidensis]|uniref:Low molecular weight phosphatase family protein n=1 Tax=Arsenicicoccus bolidensis TaxID=229480 RepID=A0ABS9Q1L0_9MICO|nr:low molecular weight phosphatase family protein [Arsenicicoccus bolidensis]MCG7321751.1 low molecular weight phosphatase family protein [Arsenicicoccus bolidensis]
MTNPTRPSVLFVCVKNAGKSQMAAALMRQACQGAVEVHSAGTHPGTAVNDASRASVERVGGSFEGEYPKAIDADLLRCIDRVILIGAEAQLTPIKGMRGTIERWTTDEPSLRGIEGDQRMDLIRDDLASRTLALKDELLTASE